MARHDLEGAVLDEGGSEKRKAVDVVPVRVREEQMRKVNAVLFELVAQSANSRSGVEHDVLITDHHLDAAGVATESNVTRRRASNASPNTPKFHVESHAYLDYSALRRCRLAPHRSRRCSTPQRVTQISPS